MLKIIKLSIAELKKILLRPTIFFIVLVLVLTCFVMNLFYSPNSKTHAEIDLTGFTVGDYYSAFKNSESTKSSSQISIDTLFDEALAKLNASNSDVNPQVVMFETKLGELKNSFSALKNDLKTTSMSSNEKNIRLSTYANDTSSLLQLYNTTFQENTSVLFVRAEFLKGYNLIKQHFESIIIYDSIQVNTVYENLVKIFNADAFFEKMIEIIDGIENIKIGLNNVDTIKEKYVIPYQTLQTTLLADITSFYNLNASETDEDTVNEFLSLVSNYQSSSLMTIDNINYSLLLKIGEDKSDLKMTKYVGYEYYNYLNYSSIITKNDYLLKNGIYDYKVYNPLYFNESSGTSTNALDYMTYTLTIASIIIAIFTITMVAKIIAGEQNNGTMKMLAIRPYSRNKIILSKVLTANFFSLLLLFFTAIVSFIVGAVQYGLPDLSINMVSVVNGTNVFASSPIVFILILIMSIFLKISVYVSISVLICILFRSYTGASIFSMLIYIGSMCLNAFCSTKFWFKYFPSANFDLYKFFTTNVSSTSTLGGFFSSPLLPDTSLLFSGLYMLGFTLLMYIISLAIFNKRDIA